MFILKRNYRVISDIFITPTFTMRVFVVLDTGAGPNFVRRRDLPSMEVHIHLGLKPNISDSNGRPLNFLVLSPSMYASERI